MSAQRIARRLVVDPAAFLDRFHQRVMRLEHVEPLVVVADA